MDQLVKLRLQRLANIINESTYLSELRLIEVSFDQLKVQYVDSGKVEQGIFDKVVSVSGNKSAIATWLLARITAGLVSPEDLDSWKNNLMFFEKNKRLFPSPDLNKYKTEQDIESFLSTVQDLKSKQGDSEESPEDSGNYVSLAAIRKLEQAGIKFLGKVDGYQVFQIPQDLEGDEEAWKLYRNELGLCSREDGGSIGLCTIANLDHFNDYLSKDDLFIIFNMSDSFSPYQFHFESGQFHDKNNDSIF